MLKAGISIIDISPEKGVQLAGYPHCPRPNKGIHDSVYASSLYLFDGETEIIFVTLDLLSIGKEIVTQLRKKFNKNIMFTASHTHSAPWASEPLASEKSEGITCDENYIKQLRTKLEKVISESIENIFDAKLGTFAGHCGSKQGVGGNRREKNGLCDPSVNVLAVKDSTDTVRACLLNYALHPTFLHAENELVTADYPAFVRRFLNFAQPKAVFMFAQGTSGDQSSRYHRITQDFEEAARVGTTLGVEVNNCINKMVYSNDIKIKVNSIQIGDLPMKTFPTIEEAEKMVEKAVAEFKASKDKDYITMRNAELAMFGAQNTLSFAKMADSKYVSPELPCEVQTVAFNDTLIVAIQGELFVEYGLEIKKLSPYAKTFVFEVSNGYLPGYIYTKEAGAEGGYEVGTSMFADNAGDVLLKKIRSMLNV